MMTEYFPSDLNMTDPYFESAKNLLFDKLDEFVLRIHCLSRIKLSY